jgi:hypothetical protein
MLGLKQHATSHSELDSKFEYWKIPKHASTSSAQAFGMNQCMTMQI